MSQLWYVNRLGNMIAPQSIQAGLPDGRWVRAVPEPYAVLTLRERFHAAWLAFTGKAQLIEWPKPGELEEALAQK